MISTDANGASASARTATQHSQPPGDEPAGWLWMPIFMAGAVPRSRAANPIKSPKIGVRAPTVRERGFAASGTPLPYGRGSDFTLTQYGLSVGFGSWR